MLSTEQHWRDQQVLKRIDQLLETAAD